jgi:hypothetical protein
VRHPPSKSSARGRRFSLTSTPYLEAVDMTLTELLPGNMGRVVLTRVALRLRRPDLLKMPVEIQLDPDLLATLMPAIAAVKKG